MRVKTHNLGAASGIHKFTLEIGKFGDWTIEEMKTLNGYKPREKTIQKYNVCDTLHLNLSEPVPDYVNWTAKVSCKCKCII